MTVELTEEVEEAVDIEEEIAHFYCPECQMCKNPVTDVMIAWCGYRRSPRPMAWAAPDEAHCAMCEESAPVNVPLTCWQCGHRMIFVL